MSPPRHYEQADVHVERTTLRQSAYQSTAQWGVFLAGVLSVIGGRLMLARKSF